jgi:hypothetical protein
VAMPAMTRRSVSIDLTVSKEYARFKDYSVQRPSHNAYFLYLNPVILCR